jgi:hypothetical protein
MSTSRLRGNDQRDPETVMFEHNRAEVPPFGEQVNVKASNGDLIQRAIVEKEVGYQAGAGLFQRVVEHPALTGTMGSGKTRETTAYISQNVEEGVNVVNVPRRKLAVNQQRSYSAMYGRQVFESRISSLLSGDETRELQSRIKALDAKVSGADRSGNMDVVNREQLLARLGHGYVVYSKADKHVG